LFRTGKGTDFDPLGTDTRLSIAKNLLKIVTVNYVGYTYSYVQFTPQPSTGSSFGNERNG